MHTVTDKNTTKRLLRRHLLCDAIYMSCDVTFFREIQWSWYTYCTYPEHTIPSSVTSTCPFVLPRRVVFSV